MLAKFTAATVLTAGLLLTTSAVAKERLACCHKQATCCAVDTSCCDRSAPTTAGAAASGDHGVVPMSTCCVKRAYCCQLKRPCCRGAKPHGGTPYATYDVPVVATAASTTSATTPTGKQIAPEETDTTAFNSCCAKRAYCCQIGRPCCRGSSSATTG